MINGLCPKCESELERSSVLGDEPTSISYYCYTCDIRFDYRGEPFEEVEEFEVKTNLGDIPTEYLDYLLGNDNE